MAVNSSVRMATDANGNPIYPGFQIGNGPPTHIPSAYGQQYLDKTYNTKYFAKGINSSLDWIRENAGTRILGQTYSYNNASLDTNGYIIASKWEAVNTSAVYTLSISMSATFTVGNKIIMALYADNGSWYPGTKLATTSEYTFTSTDLYKEIFIDLLSPVVLTKKSSYWIAYNVNSNVYYPYDADSTTSAYHGYYKQLAYDGTMPDSYPGGGTAWRLKAVSALS